MEDFEGDSGREETLVDKINNTNIEGIKMKTVDEDALELLKHISILQSILVMKPGSNNSDNDSSDSLLYLSRYAFGASIMTKKKVITMQSDLDSLKGDGSMEKDDEEERPMSPSAKEKKRQIALAMATLSMKPDRRHKLVQDGAVKTLMDLSMISDFVVRRACATAIANLSLEEDLRGAMIDAGMFATLVNMVQGAHSHTFKQVKFDASVAICNMCCSIGCEPRAIKDGVLTIIQGLPVACPDALEPCLKVCLNLSAVEEKYSRMDDITEILLHLYNSPYSRDSHVKYVLSVINNLSAMRANQLRLVEDGALKITTQTIESSQSDLRILAANCIRNLSTCNRTRQKLLDAGYIRILYNMSLDTEEEVRRSSIMCFYNFARDMACREKIVTGGAVTIVLKASKREDMELETYQVIAKTIRALCADKSTINTLVKDKVVNALRYLVGRNDKSIRQSCVESIALLLQEVHIMDQLFEQNAHQVIIKSCNELRATEEENGGKDEATMCTKEWCAYSLYYIIEYMKFTPLNKEARHDLIKQRILPALIQLCHNSSDKTKVYCASALAKITNIKEVDSSESIEMLVHQLKHNDDHQTKSDCASALYNLADVRANCDRMLNANGLLPVVRLTRSDHLQTKIKCAAILSRLSQFPQYYSQFTNDDVLLVLLDLSHLEDMLTRRRVVIALSHLTQDETILTALMKLEDTPTCIKMLISLPDEQMRRGCSAILCNLASKSGCEKQLISAGIIPTLLVTALITTDEKETKELCLKALINLMCDKSSYNAMVKDGIIWGLSSLALIDSKDMLFLCAQALCNLSTQYARDMLNSAATVKTVMMMINRGEDELDLLKNGCRVLTNMLRASRPEDKKFRLTAVESMESLSNCKDMEIAEMYILCLCLASQSSSCTGPMVELGRLAKINTMAIFNDLKVGQAYLNMYINIAYREVMRNKLVDGATIQRFADIVGLGNPELNFGVTNALYCVSCSLDNIPLLAEQNVTRIIPAILENLGEFRSDIITTLVALMFNLSVSDSTRDVLVLNGFVEVSVQLFDYVTDSDENTRSLCLAVCHMACGKVNSTKMVQQGATKLFCAMAENVNSHKHRFLQLEDIMRCSASLRNLICIVANQMTMVNDGCIKALVDIYHYAAHNNKSKAHETRRNAACALKSLTYNADIRGKLVDGEDVVEIILEDLKKDLNAENLKFKSELLHDLEAESWENGSRGSIKDGRAPEIKVLPLNLDLLKETQDVKLEVSQRETPLTKLVASIQLVEPPISVSLQEQTVKVKISDLVVYRESKDVWSDYSTMIKKMSHDVPQTSVYDLKHIESNVDSVTGHSLTLDDEEEDRSVATLDFNFQDALNKALIIDGAKSKSQSPSKVGGLGQGQENVINHSTDHMHGHGHGHSKVLGGKLEGNSSVFQPKGLRHAASRDSQSRDGGKGSGPKGDPFAKQDRHLVRHPSAHMKILASLEGLDMDAGLLGDHVPHTSTPGGSKRRPKSGPMGSSKKSNPHKKFGKLVDAINFAKKYKNKPHSDDIMQGIAKEWTDLSRF